MQPINLDNGSVFKQGSTVPVKFQLTGASAGVKDLPARLRYKESGSSTGALVELPPPSSRTGETCSATTRA